MKYNTVINEAIQNLTVIAVTPAGLQWIVNMHKNMQYSGVLTLSVWIPGFDHTPSWMKIFGHLGSIKRRNHMYMPVWADNMHSNVRLYTSSTLECSHYLCGSLGLTTPLPGRRYSAILVPLNVGITYICLYGQTTCIAM